MKKTILPLAVVAGLASVLVAPGASAIPAFANQTGQNCNACHVSFPELTPYGRYFKLSGYTLGKRPWEYPVSAPLAVMAVIGVTDTKNNTYSDGSKVDPYNGKLKPQQLSVFLGGKATNHLGAFIQWTYDGIGQSFGSDNADIRLTNTYVAPGGQEPDLIYGLDVNNNPTVQDVWNTAPAWQFPYMGSGSAITGFPFATEIDGGLGTDAVGFSGYAFWKQTVYGEFGLYRTDNGIWSVFNIGNEPDDTQRLYIKGYNPYWRFAYNKVWGPNSFEVGTFGMITHQYAAGVDSGPTDHFNDVAIDSQFQHITGINTWTAQALYIHEKENWDMSYPAASTSNPSDTLDTFRVKGSYWYRHKYGATLAYLTSSGSSDAALYGGAGSLNNKPNTTGYVLEFDYMPTDYVRLSAQYNAYTKYLGGSNYNDGTGGVRSASDNNSWFLYVWAAY